MRGSIRTPATPKTCSRRSIRSACARTPRRGAADGRGARRHGGTAARRHGDTATRRHGGTAARRHNDDTTTERHNDDDTKETPPMI
ncbi:MAG: hypothetical protein E6Q93_29765, partial [Burkholderiaceae bacterium]